MFKHQETVIPGPFAEGREPLSETQENLIKNVEPFDVADVNEFIAEAESGKQQTSIAHLEIIRNAKIMLAKVEDGEDVCSPDDIWREMRRAMVNERFLVAESYGGVIDLIGRILQRWSMSAEEDDTVSTAIMIAVTDALIQSVIMMASSKFGSHVTSRLVMDNMRHVIEQESNSNPLESLLAALNSGE